jgi:ATP-dependent helicase HrpA
VYRRSGGRTAEISEKALTEHVAARLRDVKSYDEFLQTPLPIDPDSLVPPAERAKWMALPDSIEIQAREYPLDYVIEDGTAVVRARIPEKVLWHLDEDDLPTLDRPLHWTVTRGKREAVRAETLEEARLMVGRAPSGSRKRKDRDFDPGPPRRGRGGGGRGKGGGRKGGKKRARR